MSNDLSNQDGTTGQPFRLLDLPRELLVSIVRSYRTPIKGSSIGLVIYQGEHVDKQRYRFLRRLCLTHRDILPFAQEELFKRLDIQSNETKDMLNRSMESSERCKGYAGRAESIFLGEYVDSDKLMESGAFNPRELYSMSTLKFSLLSRSCLNYLTFPALTLILSTDRLQNLRRVHLYDPQHDEALVLPNLEIYSVLRTIRINMDTSAAMKSVNLPNLRRLAIHHNYAGGSVGRLYDSIILQLDHMYLYSLPVTDVENLLLRSTALESLHVSCLNYDEGLSRVRDQFLRMDMKELIFSHWIHLETSDDWETDFELIEKFREVVVAKAGLKRVELVFMFIYSERPSYDVSAQALARWSGIKGDLESICVKRGIEVGSLMCYFEDTIDRIWCA
jgi:hypothetical protein